MFDYRIGAGNPAYLGVTRIGKDINFAVVVRDERDCRLLLYKKGYQGDDCRTSVYRRDALC